MILSGLVTGRNEVVAKVIFLHLSLILFTGGYLTSRHPPEQTPPDTRHLPPDQTRTPRAKYTPPGSSRLRNMVNERPVRILLECILVTFAICDIGILSGERIFYKYKIKRQCV